jgi:oligopeptide transport system ATP-binding protein
MSALLDIGELRVELPIGGELQPVVKGVTLSIDEGEAVGLVGESGSGKSMTARAVIRLLPPGAAVTGSIKFAGAEILDMSERELLQLRGTAVATIFQDPRVHVNPVRRIGDYLTEALLVCRGVTKAEARRRVLDLLDQTGVPDPERRLRQFPHELSGGLLQRVMIAAALAVEPRLLIADEPTTALDVTTQADVVALLDRLRRDRRLAMLFITHDLDLAAAVCDRTAVMYAGRIAEVQPSDTLHERPRHPYTAALGRSRPSLTSQSRRLHAIAGRPIAAYEAQQGCAFAPRCPHCEEGCRAEEPTLRRLADALVACHRTEELAEQLRPSPPERHRA